MKMQQSSIWKWHRAVSRCSVWCHFAKRVVDWRLVKSIQTRGTHHLCCRDCTKIFLVVQSEDPFSHASCFDFHTISQRKINSVNSVQRVESLGCDYDYAQFPSSF
ncbi:unnamed protein product [Albugo candida]|uniref:Uncharacterized protein n=1 Tax=Albugo candida TaxID=65357 RepID=A0A024FV53_9STRA|nr:unnamed protein product [Albugo candida]|eukprot:CCI10817.1 unnamed protein product [Albugo candida]